MNPNQALWEKGDFTRIARSMRRSGEQLIGRLGITKGMNVLDLGCGDGTTAIPEAMLGADVLGVDIAANLVEAGRKRAAKAGLTNCKFQQGDASNLHELKESSFDLVVSIFGAMFAPKPFDVAKEMVRVCRSGGRIVMGNWIPNDPTLVAQTLRREHLVDLFRGRLYHFIFVVLYLQGPSFLEVIRELVTVNLQLNLLTAHCDHFRLHDCGHCISSNYPGAVPSKVRFYRLRRAGGWSQF
jgi:SAM-dependent methyltransferase